VRGRIVGGLLVALLLAAGCGQSGAKNAPSVKEYEQRRAELMKRQGTPLAAHKPAKPAAADDKGLVANGGSYHYDPTGKRDPFQSFIAEQKQRMAKQERGPLEQFDLSQLTVVAVVWGTEQPRAMVEDPSGRDYVVQVGTPIGKNAGMVTEISDNSVKVRETYVDYLGAQTTKEIEMRIRSTTQGG
jgi:type IV pilus assembly protein PilP